MGNAVSKRRNRSAEKNKGLGESGTPGVLQLSGYPGGNKAACGRALLETLTEKDRTDCRCEILKHHLEETISCLEEAVPEPGTEEYARFVSCVLNPRVEHEVMTPYRRSLLEWMSAEEQRNFRKEPKLLWEKICRQIQERPEEERSSLITAPAACVRTGVGSRRSKEILFVAAARSLGIPARLNPDDGAMEYWRDGSFAPVLAECEKNCRLTLKSTEIPPGNIFRTGALPAERSMAGGPCS